MDKTTRKMVNYLKTLPKYTYYWSGDIRQNILPDDEFRSCAQYMIEKGYAEKITLSMNPGGFKLSHELIHEKEFNRIKIKQYLLDNWIALLALIFSIISIVASPFFSAFFAKLYGI